MKLPIIGNPVKSRDIIISLLSSNWPVSTKKIYTLMRKRYNVSISYQAVHKILQELLTDGVVLKENKNYQLNPKWIKELKEFSERLESLYNLPNMKGTITRTFIYTTPDYFYRNLVRMCNENCFLRLSSKTPALIISSEAEMTRWRKLYYRTLMGRLKSNKLKIMYLFSTELTKQKIIENKNITAINKLKKLIATSNIKLKHAPLHSVITMAIGRGEFMLGLASPGHSDLVGVIHTFCDTTTISRIYDNIFANAHEPYDFIKDIESVIRAKK